MIYTGLLWTAPELLRQREAKETRSTPLLIPPQGFSSYYTLQKADVYSFAIVCQEILLRNGSFYVRRDEPDACQLTPFGKYIVYILFIIRKNKL